MTKKELTDNFAKKVSITKKDAAEYFDAAVDTIKEAILSGEKVSIIGFGTFETIERAERVCRNPRTGETLTVGPKTALKFKASTTMKDALNE